MKLVVATPLFPPEPGGPATYAKLLADELPDRGIELTLVKFADVRGLPKLFRHMAYERKVAKALQDADAVLALDPVSTGYPAMRAAKKVGKPFLVKIVGDYAWEQGVQRFGVKDSLDEFVKRTEVPFPVRMLRSLQTSVAQNATHIIVPSNYLKGIVQTWGIDAARITVIGNSVAVDAIGKVPESITALPRPHVLSVGRLVPWKGMNAVIDAVATTEASLAIAGDGPLLSSLTEHAARVLPNRYTLPGRLSHEDTLASIQDADIFVLNSTYEGLSHLLIEALRLGKPIIATSAGGNGELITDGTNGLLIPSGDSAALQQALTRLLSDATLRSALSAEALRSGEAYAPEKVADATSALLRSL